MAIFISSVLLLYLFLISAYLFKILTHRKSEIHSNNLKITLLIPFRNEESNLPRILASLNSLMYDYQNHEVIFINDHSNDKGVEFLKKELIGNQKLITLPPNLTGKKAALNYGVQEAKFPIIVTTDADCFLPKNWLIEIASAFSDKTNLIFSPVHFRNSRSILARLQQLDLLAMNGFTFLFHKLRIPGLASGANLGFRKNAFLQMKGYEGNEHIPSGDDVFLHRKIFKQNAASIKFNPFNPVFTNPEPSLKAFIQQRLRWGMKIPHLNSPFLTLTFTLIYLLNVLYILSLVKTSIQADSLYGLPLLLALSALDVLFLGASSYLFKRISGLFYYPILKPIHAIYIVFIPIIGIFAKHTIWKGRKI